MNMHTYIRTCIHMHIHTYIHTHGSCEDDCYIDDGGKDGEEGPSEEQIKRARERDMMKMSMSGPQGADPTQSQTQGEAPNQRVDGDKNVFQQALGACVGQCAGQCLAECLEKSEVRGLPARPMKEAELDALRDANGGKVPKEDKIKHMECSRGCGKDCFGFCKADVNKRMSAARAHGGGTGRYGVCVRVRACVKIVLDCNDCFGFCKAYVNKRMSAARANGGGTGKYCVCVCVCARARACVRACNVCVYIYTVFVCVYIYI